MVVNCCDTIAQPEAGAVGVGATVETYAPSRAWNRVTEAVLAVETAAAEIEKLPEDMVRQIVRMLGWIMDADDERSNMLHHNATEYMCKCVLSLAVMIPLGAGDCTWRIVLPRDSYAGYSSQEQRYSPSGRCVYIGHLTKNTCSRW